MREKSRGEGKIRGEVMFRIAKFILCLICLLTFSEVGFGQILGSSSGIFSGGTSKPSTEKSSSSKKKTTASKSTTAKPASKPASKSSGNKQTTAKKPAPAKETTAKSSSRNRNSNPSVAKNSNSSGVFQNKQPANRQPQNNIVISVGKPTSGNYDELFEQAIEEGNSARDQRNYLQAESSYRKANSLKPKDSRAIYGLGNLYSDQQRWEDAEKSYRQAIVLEPDSPEAYIALSFVLSQPIAGVDLATRYAEAEKLARKALQLDNENYIAYDQLGVSLELRGIISEETQEAYRKSIQLNPNYALAFAHLGRLYRRLGKVNESSTSYSQAIKLSGDVPTMILVAEVMQSQQRYKESEQLLRRALREDEKNPTALFLLGRALTTRSSFEEAEKVLLKSIEVSPNSFVPYSILGSLYLRRNKLEETEKVLMQALKVASNGEKIQLAQELGTLGDSYSAGRRNRDAARVYRQALQLDTGNKLLQNKLTIAQKSGN